jgi:hypothetical protein
MHKEVSKWTNSSESDEVLCLKMLLTGTLKEGHVIL